MDTRDPMYTMGDASGVLHIVCLPPIEEMPGIHSRGIKFPRHVCSGSWKHRVHVLDNMLLLQHSYAQILRPELIILFTAPNGGNDTVAVAAYSRPHFGFSRAVPSAVGGKFQRKVAARHYVPALLWMDLEHALLWSAIGLHGYAASVGDEKDSLQLDRDPSRLTAQQQRPTATMNTAAQHQRPNK